MIEVLLSYLETILGPDGRAYQARACGAPMPDGRWQGWIEFVPADHTTLLRSPLETLQLNRVETVRWASQLTPEYLAMAMERALGLHGGRTPFGKTAAYS
jgi:hypothetical protein